MRSTFSVPTSSVPLARATSHELLRARLSELVAHHRDGERLPPERQLAQQWGVARMTLRRAIKSLVGEGLLEQRRGSGTYVRTQPVVRLLGLTSFSEDMRDRGLEPSSRLLSLRVGPASDAVASRLSIPPGESVVRFTRLRFGGADPMAIETVMMRSALVPGLVATDLDGSLYALLRQRYDIVPDGAIATIEPTVPAVRVQELLAIPPRQACLEISMVDHERDGRVIMVAHCIYRGDKYHLSADVRGGGFTESRARRIA